MKYCLNQANGKSVPITFKTYITHLTVSQQSLDAYIAEIFLEMCVARAMSITIIFYTTNLPSFPHILHNIQVILYPTHSLTVIIRGCKMTSRCKIEVLT